MLLAAAEHAGFDSLEVCAYPALPARVGRWLTTEFRAASTADRHARIAAVLVLPCVCASQEVVRSRCETSLLAGPSSLLIIQWQSTAAQLTGAWRAEECTTRGG